MKKILLIAIGVLLCASCKHYQRVVEKPVYIHDTLTTSHFIHDSIQLHDSTFVLLKGDTVYIDRTHTEFRYKMIHDTTSVIKEIPVEVVTTEIQEIEKPLNWFQKTLIGAGAIALLALIGFIVIKVRKAIW